ncbi:MAG: thiamine pyrophosphate-dependent enzyme, partial [Candidatus Binatia bacterium]
ARARFKRRQKEHLEKYLKSDNTLLHPDVLGTRIAEFLDPSATIIFDSFTGTSFLTDKLEAKFAGQILDAGLHQPVGHGIGMCVGAQVARPGKQVLTLMGDGGFGISAMDMETLLRHKLPAVVVLMNNSSWAGVAAGHDLFYPEMGSWDNLPGIRYDRMFKELGCHTEHVERPEEITPALDRAFASGKPAVVHVVSDTTDVHPFRLRICWGDAWSRNDLDKLPAGAREQLRKAASPGAIRRVHKFWLDNGLDIPIEELAVMADFPPEKL